MQFKAVINAAECKTTDRPLMQKEPYPVSIALQQYLQLHQKDISLPLAYKELLHYEYTNAVKDEKGKHTHWERVVYPQKAIEPLYQKLQLLYTLLKKETHAIVQSVDFCEYANSMPFRINLINLKTNQGDCFYIKSADASRIYGLELEQLLTNNPVNFLYHQHTLVEEHITGIPGDVFATTIQNLHLAKELSVEFIRFNENCFARLLGDMRSYNFVVVSNPGTTRPFIIKAIDFDQQCYEGKLNLYMPQFYKENYRYVQLATAILSDDAIEYERIRERNNIAALITKNIVRLQSLLQVMAAEEISENYKVASLSRELNQYHKTQLFTIAKTSGSLVRQQLQVLAGPYLPAGYNLAPTI